MVNTVPSDYVTGTITLTNGSAAFTGTGTGWLAMMFRQGDMILDLPDAPEYIAIIDEVTTNTAGTLTRPWLGPTLTGAYRMRYQWDAGRVTAMSAFLREELGNGNLQAFAALVGSAGGVPVFIGPGAMEVRPATDFVNGVAYDVQVDTLADRAAFDGQSEGFAVLVSDATGFPDHRAALYSKASNTVGDWTDPAYITGPIGAAPAFAAGTTTTVPPGTPADVDLVPDGSGGYLFDFDIPAGEGFVSRGVYSGATAYVKGDVVQNNGSSWIAKIATTGNAPPVLPTVSNTWWELLAAAGMNGTGTGDVVGPAGVVADRIAVFDGTSGKLIKDGGKTLLELVPEDLLVTVSLLALQVADNTNVAIFLGSTGNRVADSFDALTYVDVAGATNLDTGVPGQLRPTYTATGGTTTTVNSPASTSGIQTFTVFDRTGNLPVSKTIYRVGIYSSTARVFNLKIAQQVSSTSFNVVWAENFSHPGGGWADHTASVPYTTPASGTYNIGAHTVAGGALPDTTASGATARSFIAGNQGLGTTSGYTADSNQVFPMRYTVDSTLIPNNLTVRSASFTAATAPSKMKGLIRVFENGGIAGTDYTLECSRDGGSNWASMTLSRLFISPSPTAGVAIVEAAETIVSSQPSGTAPRWRFKTLNNTAVFLTDAYFYWS